MTDTDLGGNVCEIEMGHTAVFVERIGEHPQHEGGRRAENPEPEPLDIASAGIVAEPIDQRIVPAQYVERWLLDGRARRRLGERVRHDASCQCGDGRGSWIHFIAFHTPCQGVVGVVSGSASPSSPPPIYDAAMDTLDESIDAARSLVDGAQAITVLTGAGISTDSGIPDFRGPNGLWTKDPAAERASNINFYVGDPAVRRANWAQRAKGSLWANVDPNAGHQALVELERREKLHTLITQNVDELHQRAGSSPDRVIEIHGTTRKVACLECDYRDDMETVLDRVRAGEADPPCPNCGGILKSATISFGQSLIAEDLQRAERAAVECDLFLAVGTSLAVFPINETIKVAHQTGSKVIILNGEATVFDPIADVVLHAGISETLPRIVRAVA